MSAANVHEPVILQSDTFLIEGPLGESPMHMDPQTMSVARISAHPTAEVVNISLDPHYFVDTLARPMIPPPTNPNPGNTTGPRVVESRSLSMAIVLAGKTIWQPRRGVTNNLSMQLGFRVAQPPTGFVDQSGHLLSDVQSSHFESSPIYQIRFERGDGSGLVEAIRSGAVELKTCGIVAESGTSGGALVWLKEYVGGYWMIEVRGTPA